MMRLGLLVAAAVLVILSASGPARAQSPEETVRWIYTSRLQPGPDQGLSYLSAPARRNEYFTRRMVAFFDANDTYGDDLMMSCVDFAFDIPGQDFDAQEVTQSLSLKATGDATRQSVTASFTNFGQPAQITYDFIPEDGFWRIDDISGPGFRVSQIPCQPKTGADAGTRQGQGGNGYCFQVRDDTLRLDVAGDGRAYFSLDSWQGGGHSCGAEGPARPIEGGWVYEQTFNGAPCRIELLVTPDGGIRVTDKDWTCKPALCGQRAVLDGLSFSLDTQVDCASLPSN